jgi:hypothetical protein
MSEVPQQMRLQEELRKAIERNRRPWSGTATIERREVEEIGASLGMTHKEACVQFLALRGVLWDLRTGNIIESMIRSGDEPVDDPPRKWFAFADVVLL